MLSQIVHYRNPADKCQFNLVLMKFDMWQDFKLTKLCSMFRSLKILCNELNLKSLLSFAIEGLGLPFYWKMLKNRGKGVKF